MSQQTVTFATEEYVASLMPLGYHLNSGPIFRKSCSHCSHVLEEKETRHIDVNSKTLHLFNSSTKRSSLNTPKTTIPRTATWR